MSRKGWGEEAENKRMDTIAVLLDLRYLQVQLHLANKHGDAVEVARLNYVIAEKREKAIKFLQEAGKP